MAPTGIALNSDNEKILCSRLENKKENKGLLQLKEKMSADYRLIQLKVRSLGLCRLSKYPETVYCID